MGVERMFFNIHQCLPLKESSSQRFPRMQNKTITMLPELGRQDAVSSRCRLPTTPWPAA